MGAAECGTGHMRMCDRCVLRHFRSQEADPSCDSVILRGLSTKTSWRTARNLTSLRLTGRSKRTINFGTSLRLCQMNAERSFSETVFSRRCNRWTTRRQLSWPPKGNSFPRNVRLRNRKTSWSDSRKTSGRSSKHVWKSCRNGSKLTESWSQSMPSKFNANRRWRLWWRRKQLKTPKLLKPNSTPTTSDGFRIRQSGTANHALSFQICPCDAKQWLQQCFGAAHGGLCVGRGGRESQPDHGAHSASIGSRGLSSRTWPRSWQSPVGCIWREGMRRGHHN